MNASFCLNVPILKGKIFINQGVLYTTVMQTELCVLKINVDSMSKVACTYKIGGKLMNWPDAI